MDSCWSLPSDRQLSWANKMDTGYRWQTSVVDTACLGLQEANPALYPLSASPRGRSHYFSLIVAGLFQLTDSWAEQIKWIAAGLFQLTDSWAEQIKWIAAGLFHLTDSWAEQIKWIPDTGGRRQWWIPLASASRKRILHCIRSARRLGAGHTIFR